ncbi:homoserine O-acetyltransferase MetX [Rothia sp. P6271]|uniref:homoserine O-acetyltransferase MetX n=1 Tax=Rothia sp. P6271 TaxID=3402659 RepID=UPI003ABF0244
MQIQPQSTTTIVIGASMSTPTTLTHQHHTTIETLPLESGHTLPNATIAYETWGNLNKHKDNAVLILHALTGDTHVAHNEHNTTSGWWEDLVGAGKTIDTNTYFVVAPNILGGCNGSTGAHSTHPHKQPPQPWGSSFPKLTVRDTVHAEKHLAEALGITQWAHVIGGSLGGARALEWAITYPENVRHCAVIASGAYTTAEQLAWAQAQNLAIRSDQHFYGGDYYDKQPPSQGLGIARRIAHITYRTSEELHTRFGRTQQTQNSTQYSVESYMDYHAHKLVQRFDANSYLSINEILMSHDITRNRGTLHQTLQRSQCTWTIAYVHNDRLFYPEQSHELARALPQPVQAQAIYSPAGHDGFLLETKQLQKILEPVLKQGRKTH